MCKAFTVQNNFSFNIKEGRNWMTCKLLLQTRIEKKKKSVWCTLAFLDFSIARLRIFLVKVRTWTEENSSCMFSIPKVVLNHWENITVAGM